MKNLWIIVLAVFVIACIASQEDDNTLVVVWFEGCEYVKNGGSGGGITHKGNCRNSEH